MTDDIENETPEENAADETVNDAAMDAEVDAGGGGENDAADPADIDADADEADLDPEDNLEMFDGPDRLSELEAEAADLKDKLLRAVAETENVRRRSQREKEDALKYATAGFATDIVSVADNLDRALESVAPESRAADPALDNLMTGVEMVKRELLTSFERAGITPVDVEGQLFDPACHEALFEIENPDLPAGTVMQVIQTGFRLRDRLLRPAKVGIAKGGPKPDASAAAGPEEETSASDAAGAYDAPPETGTNLDEEL